MDLLKSMLKMMLCAGMAAAVLPAAVISAEETTVQVSENEQTVGLLYSDEPVVLEADFLPPAEHYEVTIRGDGLELIESDLDTEEKLLTLKIRDSADTDILIDCISGQDVRQFTIHVRVLSDDTQENVEEPAETTEDISGENTASFTITYDDNGGTFPAGYEKVTSFQEGDSIQLPDLTKPGWAFLGWKLTGTENMPEKSFHMDSLPGENISFTAMFELHEYRITADYGAGEPKKAMPSYCTADKKAVLPEASRPAKILSAYEVTLDSGVSYMFDVGTALPDAVLAEKPEYLGSFTVRAVWKNDPEAPRDEDILHFIHLGTGSSDGFLIESNGRYGLIDSSNPSSSRHPSYDGSKSSDLSRTGSVKHVLYYLNMLGVSHLDFVISTHAHSDHIGGIPELCEAGLIDEDTVYIYKNYAVQVDDQENDDDHHWYNQDYFDDALAAVSAKTAHLIETEDRNALLDQDVFDSYEEALAYLGAEEISGGTFSKGFRFIFGDFTIRLYNMDSDISLSNENTNSFVTLVTKGSTDALFMADMDVRLQTEQKIVRAVMQEYGKIEIFKIGHHGYTKSTSFETLLRTNPSYVIIPNSSIGNNTSIYTVLKALGAKTYLTGDSDRGIIADLTEQDTVRMYNIKDADTLSASLKEWTPSSFNFGWCRNTWEADKYNYIYMNDDRTLKYGWNNMSDGRWYYFDHTYGIMAPAQGMNGALDDRIEVTESSAANKTYTVYIKDDEDTDVTRRYVFHESGYLINTEALPEKYRKTGWQETEAGYCYWNDSYNRVLGWQYIDSKWYYFGSDFCRVTGWQKISGNTFYFDKDGVMLSGRRQIDGREYYFNDTKTGTKGALMTGPQMIGGKYYYYYAKSSPADCFLAAGSGWKLLDNTWYYLISGSALQTGWLKSGGKWYYLLPGMAVGWRKVSGVWYWFESSGAMVTGWKLISGKWYWFNSSGAMISGWKQISGKWYWFNSSGAMVTGWQKISGKWYWFNSSGAMMTGWQKISGKWYWFNSSGAMVTGTQTIGGKTYRFSADGAWIG